MALGRQHHVVEVLGEHCRREESDCSQRLLTDIDEVLFYWRRDGKNTAAERSKNRTTPRQKRRAA